jgi:DNA-binding PadR family transcriptional regulator
MDFMATTNLFIIDARHLVKPFARKRTRIPSEQQLFLLKLLMDSADPVHGYDMMKSSDLGPGTLYGLLKKLFDEGHLHRHSQIVQGRCRISYQLTDKGMHYAKRALLEAELERGIAGVPE